MTGFAYRPTTCVGCKLSSGRPQAFHYASTLRKFSLGTNLFPPIGWRNLAGYEFILQLASLLVDPLAESQLNETYARFTGEITSYPDVVYRKKRLILDELFANEVTRLGTDLAEIIAEDRKWKDLTRGELVVSVREVMANLSVYRTYRSSGAPLSPVERTIIEDACTAAIERNPSQDPSAFELVRKIIVGDYPQSEAPGEFRDRIVEWVLTFQQYTGAVMTKGVEDTAFYTYCRFIAYNEIGGDPGLFVGSLAAFHTANQIRLANAPHSLLTDSTHDTNGADVRARLYVLSKRPRFGTKRLADGTPSMRGIASWRAKGLLPTCSMNTGFTRL